MREYREISVTGEARGSRSPPARRPAPGARRAGWPAALGAAGRAILDLGLRHPGGSLGGAVALGAAALVCVNALGSQTGRHPAPILPKAVRQADAAPPRPVEKVAAAPAETPREPAPAKAAPAKAAPVGAEARPAARAVADKAPAGDPIGDLIQETTASVSPKAERPVLQAQRALVKLGYGPLKPDGVMGAGTRAAIERFERDRRLPVKGEAAGRTLRELAARAGLPPG